MDSLLLEICGQELYFDIERLSDICKIEDIDVDDDQIEEDEITPLVSNMGMQLSLIHI